MEEALREGLDLSGTLAEASDRAGRSAEKLKIADVLRATGSRADAAETLGITPRTLAAKMRDYGMDEP